MDYYDFCAALTVGHFVKTSIIIPLIYCIWFSFKALVGTCPTTWTALEGSCIKLWNQSLTWSAANSLCEEFGSKLAVINSEAKNQAISAILSTDKAWIGLYRDPKNHANWLWVDGSRLSYTNWGTDQPGNTEGCVVIYSKSGDWHDYPCADEKREIPSFYCETFGKYLSYLP